MTSEDVCRVERESCAKVIYVNAEFTLHKVESAQYFIMSSVPTLPCITILKQINTTRRGQLKHSYNLIL